MLMARLWLHIPYFQPRCQKFGRHSALHIFLLKALERGADGVLIFACHEENCQYLRGNVRAKSRLLYARNMLETIGLEKGRLEICNLATNSGVKFIEVLNDMVEQLRKMGPNPCLPSEVVKECVNDKSRSKTN